MKGLHGAIPLAVLVATARAQSAIGGPTGDDVGNGFSAETVNSFENEVNDAYFDDHSVDVDKTTIVKPHHKRAASGGSAIEGPTGDDVGSAVGKTTVNAFSNEVNDAYFDDHSVDVDKTKIIEPHHHHWRRGAPGGSAIGGPTGDDIGNFVDVPTVNSFKNEVNDFFEDDHSVDVDDKKFIGGGHGHDHDHWRRQAIGGPSGDDVGSAFGKTTVNSFSSEYNGLYSDDHSVDVDKTTIIKPGHGHPGPHRGPHVADGHPPVGFHHPVQHSRRGGPGSSAIGGPTGDDIGNFVDVPTVNDFSNEVNDFYSDDHSLDVDKTKIVNPHHKRAVRPDSSAIGGPEGDDIGNAVSAPTTNTAESETNDFHDDDHSVDVDSTEVISPPEHENHWEGGHEHEHHSTESEPAAHATAKEASGQCTQVQQVTETVTMTRTAVETHTAVVYPQEAHCENQDKASTPYGGTPVNAHCAEQDPVSSPVNDYMATPAANMATHVNDYYGSHMAKVNAPASSEVMDGAQSTYNVIPVYVPDASGTPRAHDSVVVQSSAVPSSSMFHAAIPTGVDAEWHHGAMASASASASPSTHGGLEFTGAASTTSAFGGVVAAVAGVCTLLAFAL